jgi:hypothetical protein
MGIFQNSSGQFIAMVGQGAWGEWFGGTSVVPGVWTHLAVVTTDVLLMTTVYNMTTFYVNGVAATSTGPVPYPPTSNFSIGYSPYSGQPEGFLGSIDEVRVFGVLPGRFSVSDLLLTEVPPGPDAPTLFAEPTVSPSPMIFAGGNISMNFIPSGPGPLCYQWYDGGVAIPGATASSLTLSNATVSESGEYNVVITNVYGSTTSAVDTVVVLPAGVNTITPLAYYRLGENDPGAVAGQTANSETIDIVNGVNPSRLPVRTGSKPVYGTNTGVAGSTLCINVNGDGYAYDEAITTPSNGSWGIEVWVKAASNTPNSSLTSDGLACIVYNGSDSGTADGMGIFQNSSGQFIAMLGEGASCEWLGGASVVPGVWTHVVVVTTGGTTTFYVNGIATVTTNSTPYPPTSNFSIGYNQYSGHVEGFQGSIDEVRVFGVLPGQFSTNDLLLAGVPPALSVGILLPVGTNIVVPWSGEALLQAAVLTGPWTRITNATAPCTIPEIGVSQFFRAAGQR